MRQSRGVHDHRLDETVLVGSKLRVGRVSICKAKEREAENSDADKIRRSRTGSGAAPSHAMEKESVVG